MLNLEAAYPLGASTTLALGGQNVLGNDPEENPHADARGNRFSSFTPFGVNGVFYYVRISLNFAGSR